MKKEDIYLVRGEAIEYYRAGREVLVVYARKYIESIHIGYESEHAQNNCDISEIENPSPALTAFIEEAKAHFAPKKSCGDLTMEDLQAFVDLAQGATWTNSPELFKSWATSRGIQLPSEGK